MCVWCADVSYIFNLGCEWQHSTFKQEASDPYSNTGDGIM